MNSLRHQSYGNEEQIHPRITVTSICQECVHGQKIIKTIDDRILSNTRNFFKQEEEEDYYEPEKVDKFYSKNVIICESRDDENKTLS